MKHIDFFDNSFKAFKEADKHIEKKKEGSFSIALIQFLSINSAFFICISAICYYFLSSLFESLFISLFFTMFIFIGSFVHFVTDGSDNIKDKISQPERKMREKLEQKFFEDIKGNREYIQDLASLVVDEHTHETFSSIVERLSKASDKTYFCIRSDVSTLMAQHKEYNYKKQAEEKRNSFLDKESVSIAYKIPKKEFKEHYLL